MPGKLSFQNHGNSNCSINMQTIDGNFNLSNYLKVGVMGFSVTSLYYYTTAIVLQNQTGAKESQRFIITSRNICLCCERETFGKKTASVTRHQILARRNVLRQHAESAREKYDTRGHCSRARVFQDGLLKVHIG